ncbi:MAG: hypothetical protein PHQ36_02655 [Anaerolineales bacterium]|nr:hypothetical protein [Anaerolineales bacterium]
MNTQKIGENMNPSNIGARTDRGLSSPTALNANPMTDTVPIAIIHTNTPVVEPPFIVGPMNNETTVHEVAARTNVGLLASLLEHDESEHLRARWNEIQGKFVDEPRAAVQQADVLVSEVMEKLAKMFADEHSSLEGQWKKGKDVTTEDLRKALQRYRSFFNRLVV